MQEAAGAFVTLFRRSVPLHSVLLMASGQIQAGAGPAGAGTEEPQKDQLEIQHAQAPRASSEVAQHCCHPPAGEGPWQSHDWQVAAQVNLMAFNGALWAPPKCSYSL